VVRQSCSAIATAGFIAAGMIAAMMVKLLFTRFAYPQRRPLGRLSQVQAFIASLLVQEVF